MPRAVPVCWRFRDARGHLRLCHPRSCTRSSSYTGPSSPFAAVSPAFAPYANHVLDSAAWALCCGGSVADLRYCGFQSKEFPALNQPNVRCYLSNPLSVAPRLQDDNASTRSTIGIIGFMRTPRRRCHPIEENSLRAIAAQQAVALNTRRNLYCPSGTRILRVNQRHDARATMPPIHSAWDDEVPCNKLIA